MKKTFLAISVGLLGASAAMADSGFEMFSDKKLQNKPTAHKTVAPIRMETKTEVVQNADLEKIVALQNKKVAEQEKAKAEEAKASATKAAEKTKKAESASWFAKTKDDTKTGLSAFPDNGVYDDVRYTPKDPAISKDDKKFYKLLGKIDGVHAKKNAHREKNQRKLKQYDYDVHLLAEKGNTNAIDYMCINPKKSPYIQVATMQYYCNLASINSHTEFLGYRAFEDDKNPIKIGNGLTGMKQNDHLAKYTLDREASWAYMLEAKKIKNPAVKDDVHQKLHQKQSFHWLHGNALDTFHNEFHPDK